jgi:lysozyme family protein
MTVDAMIDATIGNEGRYSNHPSDTGGETMWGITKAVARANGYTGSMMLLPRADAVRIYRDEFFVKPGFAAVAAVSPAVAEELFDTGVNMGPSVPARWFQEWLNALNSQGRDYADIPEDGKIGPGTIAAFRALRAKRGAAAADAVMLKGLNADQGARYKQLARSRVQNEDFEFGWLANRVSIAA